MILDPDTCMYDAYIFDLLPLALMHVCMMHTSIILDPDTCEDNACLYDAFINVPRSLTLMHVCMMHISMILDLHPEACMYL